MGDNEDRRKADEEFKMRMSAFMGRIEEHLSNQKESCDKHKAKTQKLNDVYFGNGSTGINTRLALVYTAIGLIAIVIGADHPMVAKMIRKLM